MDKLRRAVCNTYRFNTCGFPHAVLRRRREGRHLNERVCGVNHALGRQCERGPYSLRTPTRRKRGCETSTPEHVVVTN